MSPARRPHLRILSLALLALFVVASLPGPDSAAAAPSSASVPGKSSRAKIGAKKKAKPSQRRKAGKRARVKRARATDGRLWAALNDPPAALPPGIYGRATEGERAPAEAERNPSGDRSAVEESLQEEIAPPAEPPPPPRSAEAEPSLVWPVDGPVNSPFGPRHRRFHAGIDIGAPRSEPVVAAADGVVLYASASHGPMGKAIVLQHENALLTVYAHLSQILVKEGERVRQGESIGAVGSTGRSTGPHLHFAVRLEGKAVDPENFLPPSPEPDTPVVTGHREARSHKRILLGRR
jgi:murein DD-endopeptidase MepM/ murein hydrolase activator NlpD